MKRARDPFDSRAQADSGDRNKAKLTTGCSDVPRESIVRDVHSPIEVDCIRCEVENQACKWYVRRQCCVRGHCLEEKNIRLHVQHSSQPACCLGSKSDHGLAWRIQLQ